MKLQTSITPRRDGTVTVEGLDGKSYVFEKGTDGELSCDVTDEATVVHLLDGQLFWPADERDAQDALTLLDAAGADSGSDDGATGAPDDDEDDGVVNGGLPVEANTPPVAPRAAPRKKAGAVAG